MFLLLRFLRFSLDFLGVMLRIHEDPSSQVSPDSHKRGNDIVHRLALDGLLSVAQLDHGVSPQTIGIGTDALGEGCANKRKPVALLDDIVAEG